MNTYANIKVQTMLSFQCHKACFTVKFSLDILCLIMLWHYYFDPKHAACGDCELTVTCILFELILYHIDWQPGKNPTNVNSCCHNGVNCHLQCCNVSNMIIRLASCIEELLFCYCVTIWQLFELWVMKKCLMWGNCNWYKQVEQALLCVVHACCIEQIVYFFTLLVVGMFICIVSADCI